MKRPSTAAAPNTPPARVLAPAAKTESIRVPIEQLIESPLNPRKVRGEDPELDDLAASIAEHDIIEPIVARHSTHEAGKLEIIAGHRRHRAAKRAGRPDVPVILRDVTDVQLLELAFTENTQRRQMHALDEAEGLATLQKLDPIYGDNRILASKIGRSETYVRDRLKLLKLSAIVREALDADAITAKHAERIARLPADQHQAALCACFGSLYHADKGVAAAVERREWDDLKADLARLDDLDEWVGDHAKADLADPELQAQFPELAVAGAVVEEDEGENPNVSALLQLSEAHLQRDEAKALNVIPAHGWKEVKLARNLCAYTQRGAVVHGGPLRLLDVCTRKSCEQHFPKDKATPNSATQRPAYDHKAEEEKRVAREAEWNAVKGRYYAAFFAQTKNLKITPALLRKAVNDIPYQEREFKLPLTEKNMGQHLALSIIRRNYPEYTLPDMKKFGVKVDVITKQIAKEKAAAKKAETKAAAPAKGKKGAKGRAA